MVEAVKEAAAAVVEKEAEGQGNKSCGLVFIYLKFAKRFRFSEAVFVYSGANLAVNRMTFKRF